MDPHADALLIPLWRGMQIIKCFGKNMSDAHINIAQFIQPLIMQLPEHHFFLDEFDAVIQDDTNTRYHENPCEEQARLKIV